MSKYIYDYIVTEESSYQTRGVPITDTWEWSMYNHIKRSTLYKNSQFETGKIGDRPFKNIIRPILNVAYRSEGFDVKDIEAFVNDIKNYYKSFLVNKFHDKWARKNGIDTFIDDMVESYVDYGGVLVKNVNQVAPEVIPLQRLAFCDQTDILSGPICEKHMYSPDQLKDMVKQGWNSDAITQAITQATATKPASETQGQSAKTPGKYIEVYELHGVFPESCLSAKDESYNSDSNYIRQFHAVCHYKDKDGNKQGLSLYLGKEKDPYKFLSRDKIYGRTLGFGGIEELFEPQIWTNYSEIQIKEMLDKAALMLLQTASESFATKNKITDMEKGQILVHEDNKPISTVNFQAINMKEFENSVIQWENHARTTGSANDAQLGVSPSSGTPFKLQELVVSSGQGLHDWRRGKIASFMSEIYRDWGIKYLVNDMNKGDKWVEELSLDELNEIADRIATNYANEKIKKDLIAGKKTSPEEQQALMQKAKDDFKRGGSKKFLQIFKDEMKGAPVDVYMNVAGKQKDMAKVSEKITNIIRQIIAAPQILQIPGMAKIFNELLESAGLSPIDFAGITKEQISPPKQPDAKVAPNEVQPEINQNNLQPA